MNAYPYTSHTGDGYLRAKISKILHPLATIISICIYVNKTTKLTFRIYLTFIAFW